MSEVEQGQRAPLDPNMGLGEFLTSMQLLAGVPQRAFSEEFQVSQQSVSRWMKGTSTPAFDSDNTLHIKKTFGLTDEELRGLIANNAPWERPDTTSVSSASTNARRRLGVSLLSRPEENIPNRSYAAQMLGAFVVRAENGPPLNEVEANLIRFLVQTEIEAPTPRD
ncbi:helix-turn-helix transcriptional regulator [Candidatus Saccharibacteria bacterium]|nr:helix-turn-helix transcriptional regulator [Candidatus Saccharibacteria bacterium]MBI3337858.1 helix-turn-helix transcriptional regulator [Candidatus Saccharibacteria bacterium]